MRRAVGRELISASLDEIAFDEDFTKGGEIGESLEETSNKVDFENLYRAVCIESAALATILAGSNRLLASCGDLKISRAITLAQSHLAAGDKVLLFSRYTDTIDALVEAFSRSDNGVHSFGVYTGQRSVRVDGEKETQLTKTEIKRALESGEVPIVFCSDAASEGLNLQAARILINVDVPWTPARLEQRIGRVARLGQKATEVVIYNIWYPNSVEAKMYSRIQHRLDETNIAIGEFPEVVADAILDSIVSGGDNDGVYELQEIRNSLQARSLNRLWSERDSDVTTSRFVREGLLSLCGETFKQVSTVGDSNIYEVAEGITVSLTAEEGCSDSISLTSLPWQYADFDMESFVALSDKQGNPAVFARSDDYSGWLSHEYLVDLLLGKQIGPDGLDGRFPKMLPNNQGLSFGFAMDAECPERPDFWPPKM